MGFLDNSVDVRSSVFDFDYIHLEFLDLFCVFKGAVFTFILDQGLVRPGELDRMLCNYNEIIFNI